MLRSTCAAFAYLALLTLCSCSGSSGQLSTETVQSRSGSFLLQVLEESFIDEGAAGRIELTTRYAGQELIAEVRSVDARGLKALYFEMEYDALRFTPLSAEATGELGAAESIIELAVLSERGSVQHGQVLANWDRQSGFSGDAVLARLRFAQRPFGAGSARGVSVPPLNEKSITPTILREDPPDIELLWFYTNNGDYNQDGLVGIADLTPLGLHFGESPPASPLSLLAQIDGDGNGEINISDLTPIGQNFGSSVNGGYNLYRSANIADYPAAPAAESTIPAFEHIEFSALLGDPALQRLAYNHAAPAPAGAEYFWVRPLDSAGTEGIPGNLTLRPQPSTLAISLVTPALDGDGSELLPYFLMPGESYELMLTHGVDGNVTDSEFTFFSVELPGGVIGEEGPPAQWNPETNSVETIADEEGVFVVDATYGSQNADAAIYFRVIDPDNVLPIASFSADVDEGTAPFPVNLDASTSGDSDGFIERYEWDMDGDGTFETIQFFEFASTTITEGGTTSISLRVVDDDGATSAVFTRPIFAEGWIHTDVADVGDATQPASPVLRVANGKPLIAYRGFSNLNMGYSSDALGSSWSVNSLSDAFVPEQICMEIIGGRPALAWRRSGATDPGIYYSYSANADGLGFPGHVNVHPGSGHYAPSLAEIDGNPALAYIYHTEAPIRPYSLFYVRSLDSEGNDGGDWDLFTGQNLFDAEEFWMDRNSLQQVDTQVLSVDGRPGIFFIAFNDELMQNWQLRFMKAENNAATEWTFPGPLQFAGSSQIEFMSVTSIVDRPRFVYRIAASHGLSYRTCSDLAAEDWGSIFGISDAVVGEQRGYFNSLANIGGFPALLHYDALNDQLRFLQSSTATGEGGWGAGLGGPVVADVGQYDVTRKHDYYTSLYALGGRPAMVYHDVVNGKLVFARYHVLP